jgi:ubiquinone biosynthesis protein
VEGLGRQLYPELDIWQTASPVLRRWMRERMSPRTVLRDLRRGWPDVLEILKALPPHVQRMLERSRDGMLPVRADGLALEPLRLELVERSRRRDRALVSSALLLGSVLWFGQGLQPRPIGALLGILGLLGCLLAWLPGARARS